MSAEEIYDQACKSSKIEPQKEVTAALNAIPVSGELDLSSTNLNAWTWQIIGKIISTCNEIRKVNFSNCLIPPRGLVPLLTALGQSTQIQSLDLRGNNIQTTSVTHLGRMLRHNISLTRLTLEWNSLGVFPDTFVTFCDGLAVNQTLQVLDLRNNQLSSECAISLSNCLMRNKALRTVDLRWNNLGWKGGQLLHTVFNSNQILTKLKLQGNCIPLELTMAIERCAEHNATRANILQECAARTDLLARQLKKADEERCREIQGLSKQSDEKMHQIIKASDARVNQMEILLAEKDTRLAEQADQLKKLESELNASLERNQQMVDQLKERDESYQDLLQRSRMEVEDISQALAKKEESLSDTILELKGKLNAEQKRRGALEIVNQSQAEEVSRLETEVLQLKEKMNRARRLHDELLQKEQESHKEIVAGLEKECEARMNKIISETNLQRSNLRLQIQDLERTVEEHERTKLELNAALTRERARREEEVAIAIQETRTRESCRTTQLEEKLSALREEKVSLEKQLAVAHASVLQVQQQNNSLIAEMAEPQRKLSQIHEELSSERLISQRLRQELADETTRFQAKKMEAERLQAEVEKLHEQLNEAVRSKQEIKREQEQERERLLALMDQRDKEIQSIRAEEMERAGVLYSAFNKYLGSLSPSTTKFFDNEGSDVVVPRVS
ncbi:leucine-rich repeat-containing protein 45 [Anabrus simplex]|uniref:leucine-rich repeat-containing protein 45 n=1 Tax=Anabrus simplex TaxID=316456 RepID=UPI0035A29A8A